MTTIKELRELLDTLPDDMPVYAYRNDMEAGRIIEAVSLPRVQGLVKTERQVRDAFDGTTYTKHSMRTLYKEESQKDSLQALLFY